MGEIMGAKYYVRLLIVLVSMEHGIKACQCDMKHPQEIWCQADFGVIARVTGQRYVIPHSVANTYARGTAALQRYPIRILRVLKKNTEFRKVKKGFVLSAASGLACEVRLCPRKKYLLTGQIKERKLLISSCGWIQEYKTLTYAQKHGIKQLYSKNCDCQIGRCKGYDCNTKSTHVCDMITIIWSCYTRYGICIKRKAGKHKGTCHWKHNNKFHKCLKRHYYDRRHKHH